MVETHYDVVFRGKLLPAFDTETVKRNLMGAFSLSGEKAEKILSSNAVMLKKGVDEALARKYAAALERAGLRVVLNKSKSRESAENAPSATGSQKTEGLSAVGPEDRGQKGEGFSGKVVPMPPSQVSTKELNKIPFRFYGKGSEYFKIWLVNVVLSVVTLGIYSAWAKVRRKQYFYGSTRIKEAGFDYLADPVKILKGRLIVVGFFILYSLLSNLVPIVAFILSLTFLVALPWMVVRSLAFNAHNSALRNIRFGFHGTFKEAAKAYVLWPIVAAFTFGVLSPYVYFRQKKFVVENTSYGKTRFTFSATARDYYGIFFSALIPVVIGIGVVVGSGFLAIPLAILASLVLYLYLFALFSVKTTNLLFNATALSLHRMEADLKTKDYAILVMTNTLAIAMTLGLFHPWAKVRTVRYRLEHISLRATGDLDSFVADEQGQVSVLGDEMSDFMDFDFGL